MKSNKKGVSPIVSTVLLIMIVLIIAIIILIWAFGFVKEAVTKTIGDQTKAAEQFCVEIKLLPSVTEDGTTLVISNNGNVPIYALNIKVLGTDGKSIIKKVTTENNGSINPGINKKIDLTPDGIGFGNYNDYKSIKIIPILLGKKAKSGGTNEFPCPETYAIEV